VDVSRRSPHFYSFLIWLSYSFSFISFYIYNMNKVLLAFLLLLFYSFPTQAQSVYVCRGNSYTEVALRTGLALEYSPDGMQVALDGVTYNLSEVDSITFERPTFSTTQSDTVYVTYRDSSATVVVNNDSVTSSVSGADVVLQADVTGSELVYVVSGTSADGSLFIAGSYKITVILNNLTLTNADGYAINIQDGKRINLVVLEGTTSTLVDGAGGGQKGCIMVKGHTELKGAGTLNLTGNANHAFWGDEYVEVKASFGTLNVLGAVADGLHVKQYYLQNGGTVKIENVGDDGLQCAIDDSNDEGDTGAVTIQGGTLCITTPSSVAAAKGIKAEGPVLINDAKSTPTVTITTQGAQERDTDESEYNVCAAISTDSTYTQTAGTVVLKSTGAASRGLKADGDILISGGSLSATTTGGGFYDTYEADTRACAGIKAEAGFTVSGGSVTCSSTGAGGKGIKGDGVMVLAGGTVTVSTSGGQYSYSRATSSPKGIKCDGDITLSGSTIDVTTTGKNGEGIESKASILVSGGVVNISAYDDGINAATALTQTGGYLCSLGTNNDGIDSNGSLTVTGGTMIGWGTTSPEEGIDIVEDATIKITGGTVLGVGGGLSPASGTVGMFSTTGSVTAGSTLTFMSGGSTLLSVEVPSNFSGSKNGGRFAPGGGPGGGGNPGGGSGSGSTIFFANEGLSSGSSCTVASNGSTLATVTASNSVSSSQGGR